MNVRKNAVRGTTFGFLLMFLQILSQVIIRAVFIRTLGAVYLGLNSLFGSILQILNQAEFAVVPVLVYAMYQPIAEGDSDKICRLMNLYKIYYRIIGFVILGAGLLLIPALPHLISGEIPEGISLTAIYLLNLFALVLHYWLFSYKSTVFYAHQRNDIVSVLSSLIVIVRTVLQILTLLVFKNYYYFLLLTLFGQALQNIITALMSRKVYPEYRPRGQVSDSERKEINGKVRDLSLAKIGNIFSDSADSIVLSAFLGLSLLAVFHNYLSIITGLKTLFDIFFAACTAGIGNRLVTRSEEENRSLLYNLHHLTFFATGFCCACYVSICQPFVKLWVGGEYVLDTEYALLIVLYLLVTEAARTLVLFRDAGGLWKIDRFRPLVCGTLNLVLNLLLIRRTGLYGVILATVVTGILSFFWIFKNVNENLFPLGVRRFLMKTLGYIAVIASGSALSWYLGSLIVTGSQILLMILRLLIAGTVSVLLFQCVYWKTEENRYLIAQLKSVGKKMIHVRGKAK